MIEIGNNRVQVEHGMSMLDYIKAQAEHENDVITLDEFSSAMRSGNRAQIEEAVSRMEAAGGYDNLD